MDTTLPLLRMSIIVRYSGRRPRVPDASANSLGDPAGDGSQVVAPALATASRRAAGRCGSRRNPPQAALARVDNQARLIASRLTAAGKPVSRRALRSEGIKGSNQALNALARRINAELADAGLPAELEDAAPRS